LNFILVPALVHRGGACTRCSLPPSVRLKGGSLISLRRRLILVAVDAVPLIAGGGVDWTLSRPPSFIVGKLAFYLLPPAFVRKDSPSSFLR